MLSTPVTAFYAGLLAVFYLYLSALIILYRRNHKIGLGDGGDRHFTQLIRSHGNFAEYVPLVLILSLIAEMNEVNAPALHISGVCILFGRLIHAYGLRHHYGASWQRLVGGGLTFAAMAILAVLNLLVLY